MIAASAGGVVSGVPPLLWAVFAVVVVLVNGSTRLYRSRLSLSALDDVPALVIGAMLAMVAALAAVLGGRGPLTLGTGLRLALIYLVGVVIGRALCYALVRRARRSPRFGHPTVIIGAGKVGDRLARIMQERPEHGLHPVGFIDLDPLISGSDLPAPVLGSPKDLARTIATHDVEVVVVAFSMASESSLVDVMHTCDRLEVEIFVVPRLFEVQGAVNAADRLWGMPLMRPKRAVHRAPSWYLKRPVDALVAAVALIATAPLMALLALAVRLDGGPGVIFRQRRVGLDGSEFELFKFRSMRVVDLADSATTWTVVRDERLTRVGRVLRRTSLDELPQLVNVLRGDMSLVGPRPERPHFVAEFAGRLPRYSARHRVRAGLTGWAQVHGLRGDTSIADRARFDNYYIENWSLWMDVKIVLRTVTSLFKGAG